MKILQAHERFSISYGIQENKLDSILVQMYRRAPALFRSIILQSTLKPPFFFLRDLEQKYL